MTYLGTKSARKIREVFNTEMLTQIERFIKAAEVHLLIQYVTLSVFFVAHCNV